MQVTHFFLFSLGSRPAPPLTLLVACALSPVAGHQIKAKALKRAVDIGRPSIPPQQLQGLWAMAQDNPEAIAQRFGAPKVPTYLVVLRILRKGVGNPHRHVERSFFKPSWRPPPRPPLNFCVPILTWSCARRCLRLSQPLK